jgi:C1A family cysteine protease
VIWARERGKLLGLMHDRKLRKFGWCPDLPDHRDYHLRHDAVVDTLRHLKLVTRRSSNLPESVDWREYGGPVEDQQDLGTSAAHACVALVQQCERRSSGRLLRPSRLFVHSVACRLQGGAGNAGTPLRAVLRALMQCGAPPERYWPYDVSRIECEPDPFMYSFQRSFGSIRYVRLDSSELSGEQILVRLRSFLAAGFPFVFGFPVCTSLSEDADVPLPIRADGVLGGQAVVAVGYDDSRRIRSDKGALLVRNSWGPEWGDAGYGWLPYTYVKKRLAMDFWTVLKPAWLRSGEFELPQAADETVAR